MAITAFEAQFVCKNSRVELSVWSPFVVPDPWFHELWHAGLPQPGQLCPEPVPVVEVLPGSRVVKELGVVARTAAQVWFTKTSYELLLKN